MKKLVSAVLYAMVLCGAGVASQARADGCYICTGGSSCGEQCRYGGSDTGDARKACEKRGCKIGGTKSCSTAANVKTCSLRDEKLPTEVVAWTSVSSID